MIIGKIEGVNFKEGTGPSGKDWQRWEFALNGKKYSTFNADIGKKFKIGDTVKIEGTQGEKYFDMKSMDYWTGNDMVDVPIVKPGQPISKPMNIQTSIMKQCSLKAAVELAKSREGCDIIQTAQIFFDWLKKE